jgi:Ca2+-binding RTX toxin-like protein
MSKPIIHGTAGDDSLTGTSGNDYFSLGQGGSDSASGLGGNDTFSMQGALDAGDQLDGGAGNDVVILDGNYAGGLTFTATTLTSIETLRLDAGFSYDLTSVDETVAAGAAMKIDGSSLAAANSLAFDGSAETNGLYHLVGGAGDDALKGGADGNTFNLTHGGEDTATGGAGDDVFTLGATLDAGDKISGGSGGDDVLRLDGDYSAGLTLGPDTLSNIATIQFHKGHSYNLTVDNANFLSGPTALINAGALGSVNSLTFDASASDANFHFIGGAGNDVLTGGTASAAFDLSHGGHDTATGGAGNDSFNMGTTFTAADKIDGGAGNDTVVMNGMGAADSLTFSATTVVNVEMLTLQASYNYDLITNNATVAAGATLLVAGNTLGAGDTLTFDGAAETDGHFIIRGGAGNDNLTGGQDGDTFNLIQGGEDTVHGGSGNDTITVGASFDAGDQIDGGTGNDSVELNGDYSAGLTFGAATMTNVETLSLAAGHSYNLTTNDANVASGQTLTVDASALAAADTLTFHGSAETNGYFAIAGGAGNDTVTLGSRAVLAGSTLNGGAGTDTLVLNGDFSSALTFSASTITNVENLTLAAGHSYNLITNDANVANGATLTVDASALGAGNILTFNCAAETNGFFSFLFAGNFTASDSITGGPNAVDSVSLNGDYSAGLTFGASTMTGVEFLDLTAGHSYKLTTNDATVAAGQILVVNAPLLASDALTFNGGAETNGVFSFELGGNFKASDSITGGAGNDYLYLNGDYSAGLTLGATTLTNVEYIGLQGGHSYNLTANDATVASAKTLTIDASGLGTGDTFIFNGSAETNGAFIIDAGAGNDTLTGGAEEDTFNMGANLTAADTINGGAGTDFVKLNGDYSAGLTFGASTITNVESLWLLGAFSYNLTTNDANVASGATLTVDAGLLGSGNALTFDGSAETNGFFAVTGGAGNDSVTIGARAVLLGSTFNGGGGSNTLTLNGDFSTATTLGANTLASVHT